MTRGACSGQAVWDHPVMDLAALELVVQRLRDAEAAADAARADVELEAVAVVRKGAPVERVCEVTGLNPHDLLRLEKTAGEVPPS